MEKPSLLKLFTSFFQINLLTFGGGYSIIAVISKTFVEKYHYLSEDEMLNMVALCPSVPGALSVNATVLVGYRLRGFKGALVCFVGAILPPLFIITVIFYFYAEFQANPYIQAALNGMRGAVCAVMLFATYSMAKSVLKKHILFSVILMVAVFLLGIYSGIPTAVLILCSGAIGFLYFKVIRNMLLKEVD